MTADRRDHIVSALADLDVDLMTDEALADALLPTVDALIRQAQAEALEAAASDWAADPDAVGDSEKDARNWLRDRAAALRLTTDPLDVTQTANARPEMPLEGAETPSPVSPEPPDAAQSR